MSRILPDWLVGSLAGLALGFMASFSLVLIDPNVGNSPNYAGVALALFGAVCGGLVGARLRRPAAEGGTVARWCAGMAAVVGGVGFLAGFVGPVILRPDAPQGPLLGIFFTGPLGAVAGAAIGAIIGLMRQGRHAT
jgi:hypothetical protein